MTTAQDGFHAKVPRSEPLTTRGHAPGVLVGNDAVPTFHAETLPAGSAPADRTFKPNPVSETPGQADNDAMLASEGKESTYTSAESTLGGATSADVHTGLGKPLSGQVANDNKEKSQKGLVGVGAGGVPSMNKTTDGRLETDEGLVDQNDDGSGNKYSGETDIQSKPTVSADELAAELD